MKDNEVYHLWDCEQLAYPDQRTGYAVIFFPESLKILSSSGKSIAAYYSTRISPYIALHNETEGASAFGDYHTMQDVQGNLLRKWQYTDTLPAANEENCYVLELYAMKSGNRLLFWYASRNDRQTELDEFEVGQDGKISHVRYVAEAAIDRKTGQPK